MKLSDVLSTVLSIPGAAMGRANKVNFVVVPTDDGYVKVNLTEAQTKDTKRSKAFNAEAAIAEYRAWEAERALRLAEQAAKPKVPKGPNPEAQARRDALDAAVTNLPSFENWTATDILNALTENGTDGNQTVMAVGSAAKRLVASGVLTVETNDKGKSFYTKG